jgi:predicted kinase
MPGEVKKISVMRGIPGSGKSTYARRIQQEANAVHQQEQERFFLLRLALPCQIVSADQFFMENGVYRFDPKKLGDAHRQCMRDFLNLVTQGCEHVIVDNTNLNVEDASPYVAVGEAMGYEVTVVQIHCPPSVAAARNLHGVPAKRIVGDMTYRFESCKLPRHWKVIEVDAGHIQGD